jgi:hypothetical protein
MRTRGGLRELGVCDYSTPKLGVRSLKFDLRQMPAMGVRVGVQVCTPYSSASPAALRHAGKRIGVRS